MIQSPDPPMNRRRLAMLIGGVVIGVLALWFLSRIPVTVTIFVIAAFLASAVHPLAEALEHRRMPRPLAITVVFTIVILVVTICLVFVFPLLFAQVQVLAAHVPAYLQLAQTWANDMRALLVKRFPGINLPPQFFDLQQVGVDRITGLVTAGLASLGVIAVHIATAFFIATSALVLSFFMLLNHRALATGFASLFPTRRRETALLLASQIVHVFGSFITGQIIVSGITGILIAAITAALGFKFALLLGLVSAVAYAIPIVGILAAHIIAFVLAAPQGMGTVLWVEVVVFVVARVSDNILVPKIMGGSLGVSPIGVIFAVFAGGELFGLPGLILGIPAAALIKLIWGYFIGPWLHAQIEFTDLAAPQPEPVMERVAVVTLTPEQ